MLLFVRCKFAYILLNKISQIICSISPFRTLNRRLKTYCKSIDGLRAINDDFIRYVLKKRDGIDLHANDIFTIALRGSGADYGIVGNSDNRIYNLGLTSSDLYAAYHMYLSTLKSLPQLKNIVLFYSVSCCGLDLIKTIEKYRQVVYSYIFQFPLPHNADINSKYVRYIQNKVDKVSKAYATNLSNRFWGYDKKTAYMKVNANVRIISHMRENRREPNQLSYLKELASTIQNDNRHLYVVLPPYRKDYLTLLPPKEILYKSLYSLDLPENTSIVDFHDSHLFSDLDFGDTDHMSSSGAEKLTNLLLEYIR